MLQYYTTIDYNMVFEILDMGRHGKAWRAMAWHGMAWHGVALCGVPTMYRIWTGRLTQNLAKKRKKKHGKFGKFRKKQGVFR